MNNELRGEIQSSSQDSKDSTTTDETSSESSVEPEDHGIYQVFNTAALCIHVNVLIIPYIVENWSHQPV